MFILWVILDGRTNLRVLMRSSEKEDTLTKSPSILWSSRRVLTRQLKWLRLNRERLQKLEWAKKVITKLKEEKKEKWKSSGKNQREERETGIQSVHIIAEMTETEDSEDTAMNEQTKEIEEIEETFTIEEIEDIKKMKQFILKNNAKQAAAL